MSRSSSALTLCLSCSGTPEAPQVLELFSYALLRASPSALRCISSASATSLRRRSAMSSPASASVGAETGRGHWAPRHGIVGCFEADQLEADGGGGNSRRHAWSMAARSLETNRTDAVAKYAQLIYRANREAIGPDADLLFSGQALELPPVLSLAGKNQDSGASKGEITGGGARRAPTSRRALQ